MSLLERYRQKIKQNQLKPDKTQATAVELLQVIQTRLLATPVATYQQKVSADGEEGWFNRWSRRFSESWFNKQTRGNNTQTVTEGVYLWGGVGRGKTWLMDQFFETTAIPDKQRHHFNHFMLLLHEMLKNRTDQRDPLAVVAADMAKQMRLLCLDELHLTEIANAMLLLPFLEDLMRAGVVIVVTSNRHPKDLYQGGIQQQRFVPYSLFLQQYMRVIQLDSGVDYRMYRATQQVKGALTVYARQEVEMPDCFQRLSQGQVQTEIMLMINGRDVMAKQVSDNVAWFDFVVLCETTRTTSDYIWLSDRYAVIMLSGVPVMDESKDPAARRFFYLVDELYDRKIRFIFSADVTLDQLYQGHRLQFAFKRTLSRLLAMHSENRLACDNRV